MEKSTIAGSVCWPVTSVLGAVKCTAGALFLFGALAAHSIASAQELQVRFIGGGAQGAWTRALTAKAECLRQNSDIEATVTPTQGGMDLFAQLNEGRADFGMTYQSVLVNAWNGEGAFEGRPMQNIRIVGVSEQLAVVHWVVSKDSGIESVADLKGKRFAPGPVGSISRTLVTNFLDSVDMLDQIEAMNVSSSEMNSYLKDGKLDGWAWMGGVPTPAMTEIAISDAARFIDIENELDETGFFEKNPFFVKTTIEPGSYPGIDYATTSFGQNGVFVAHKDVPDEVVYRVAEVLWSDECIDYLSDNLRSLVAMRDSPLVGVAFPMHPGALKLWEDKGLDTSGIPTEEDF